MKAYIIDEKQTGQRLDKFLKRVLPNASAGFLCKMLRKKNITLNGKKAEPGEIVKTGDEIKVFFSDETFEKFSGAADTGKTVGNGAEIAENIKIPSLEKDEIVYEDGNIIICFKKAGELSQKANPDDVSINERIREYLKGEEITGFVTSVANRLDRNTEGLIVAGKNPHAQAVLSALFRERKLDKFYLATLKGRLETEKDLKLYLKKNENTNKVEISGEKREGWEFTHSRFVPLVSNADYTLAAVDLLTGKSHQIRAHAAFIGHPVLCDPKYGDREVNLDIKKKYRLNHQLLTAAFLHFPDDCELEEIAGKSFYRESGEKVIDFWKGEGLWQPGNQEALEALALKKP